MDALPAHSVVACDDDVDGHYGPISPEFSRYITADPETINGAPHPLWAAHNLEHIADRVTNIRERVVFAVTGQLKEIGTATY